MTRERFVQYAARLILVDFVVAAIGAYCGVQFYFWSATIHCGH